MVKKLKLDEDNISESYMRGESTCSIGRRLGIPANTIRRRLIGLSVPIRDYSESRIPHVGMEKALETYRNKEWLSEKYIKDGLSQKRIAEICGVKSTVICVWMKRLGVPARERSMPNICCLTDDFIECLDGLLLGDGCLVKIRETSACYSHGGSHYDYIAYLSGVFDSFGIEQSGKIYSKSSRIGIYESVGFSFHTRAYRDLLEQRYRWYPEGKKIVPDDVVLTPIVAQNWFIGDGRLARNRKSSHFIILCTNGFSADDVVALIKKLRDIGIIGVRQPSNNTIRLNHENTLKFLNYIGPCPEPIWHCYGYKWDLTRTKKEWEAEFARP